MPTISQQRAEQLYNEYQQLKVRVTEVENKYSLSPLNLDLNFPDSLGLEMLTFTPLSDAEIHQLAYSLVNYRYEGKRRVANNNYLKNLDRLTAQENTINRKKNYWERKYDRKMEEKRIKLSHKIVNNGLFTSSIAGKAERELIEAVTAEQTDKDRDFNAMLAEIGRQKEQLESQKRTNDLAINEEEERDVIRTIAELRQKEERVRLSIEKYNQMVEEKEAKYRFNVERATQLARQAEYTRALNAAKIYAQLGESGVRRQQLSEILQVCRLHFFGYTRAEADYVLSLDSFLNVHLAEYYSTFIDWLNSAIPR